MKALCPLCFPESAPQMGPGAGSWLGSPRWVWRRAALRPPNALKGRSLDTPRCTAGTSGHARTRSEGVVAPRRQGRLRGVSDPDWLPGAGGGAPAASPCCCFRVAAPAAGAAAATPGVPEVTSWASGLGRGLGIREGQGPDPGQRALRPCEVRAPGVPARSSGGASDPARPSGCLDPNLAFRAGGRTPRPLQPDPARDSFRFALRA